MCEYPTDLHEVLHNLKPENIVLNVCGAYISYMMKKRNC